MSNREEKMSNLKIYNTLTRQLEDFKAITPGRVNIYVCGPTVYDDAHLGHARCYIIWDVVTRYFKFKGYKLNYVRNITDVDDKIINRAKRNNTTPEEITKKYIEEFANDMKSINVATPDCEPKATEYIEEMISFIAKLVDKGNAYVVDEDVYFSVDSCKDYGKLSHQKLEDLKSGARVEKDEKKKNPLDFVLWKSVDADETIYWQSPWGKGRPGWHTECCAMINKLMGDTIDIHAGGMDLAFPHHENERAQSESLTGKPFVNYWMHNGFVNVESEKMSKSLDNFKTIKDLANSYDSNTIRLFILTNHYRMPVDFRNEALTSAKNGIKKIKNALKDANITLTDKAICKERMTKAADIFIKRIFEDDEIYDLKEEHPGFANRFGLEEICSTSPTALKELSSIAWRVKEFIASMDNDFNTSKAIAILFDLASMLQKNRNEIVHGKNFDVDTLNIMVFESVILEKLAVVLGFDFDNDFKKQVDNSMVNELIETMIKLRNEARAGKNWLIADSIRDKLKDLKILVKDNKDGTTTWEFEE